MTDMMTQQAASPMDRDPVATMTPYADRELRKAKDDYARAAGSGQFDEIQMEELWHKTNDYINKLRKSASETTPPRAQETLRQEFDQSVLPVDGKLIQKDPQSGRFEVLSEPVKDARQMEEMQFQQTLDTHKGRIDLMKQLIGMQSGNAETGQKPMYTPEQVKAEVDRMIPPPNPTMSGQGGGQITPEQFDAQWKQLPSGGTLTGPDGKLYRKK